MDAPEHTQEIDGVPIQRFPASMTGRKLRKRLGLPEFTQVFQDHDFRVAKKFKNVKRPRRLGFLISQSKKVVGTRSFSELRSVRGAFNQIKANHLPMSETCPCYVCEGQATIRHHVISLLNGGRNKSNNIVPLCAACHAKIHPHLKKSMGGSFPAQRTAVN